jgi:hypothetical protein
VTLPPFWALEGFYDLVGRWIGQEQPSADLIDVVLDWTQSLYDDPYRSGLKREPSQPNLYWGQIPGTLHDDHVVTCGFWIFEATRTLRCYGYATLSLPL